MSKYNDFSDTEIARKAYDWLKESRENEEQWREFSEKEFNYYLGRQWSNEDQARMQETKRAALTINQLRALIKLVTGYQRQNRYPIRIYGSQLEDEGTAGLLEELVQNIVADQLYQYQDSQRFLHSLVCGRGYMLGKVDYSDDWLGEIKLHSRINPRHVYLDPMSRDITYGDAEYIIWVELVRDSALQHLIGDKDIADIKIQELQNLDWEQDFEPEDWPVVGTKNIVKNPADRFWSKKRGGIIPKGAYYKVVNIQYKMWENEYFLADRTTGQLGPVTSKKEGENMVRAMPGELMMVQRRTKKIKHAMVVGDQVIDHTESATGHRHFSLIPYFAGYLLGETFGLIRDLTDIQDFVNKRFSNYAHSLNTTANPGWIGDEDAVKDWTTFEKDASKPAPVIKKRKGSELKRLEAGSIPTGETRGMSDGTELIKIVSGINPDLVGQSDKDTSGRAIMLRQQQGYQILAENVDNHRLSTVITTQWIIDAIQNNYTYEKTFRVIMPDNQVKYMTVNQRVQDMMTGIEKVLNDVTVGDYDVVVSDQSISPSMRYLHFQELIEIVQQTGVGIPPDVLVKASNLPQDMKQEIIQAMQQAVVPGPASVGGNQQPPAEVPQMPDMA